MPLNVYAWQQPLFRSLLGNREKLPHALLLKGKSGTGKLHFAQSLARALLCESPRMDGSACLSCTACNWFDHGIHPDFRLLEPEIDENGKKAAQITIDQVRSLVSFMNMTTHRNGYRIVLIHPADAMNVHSANALLKTLEEPHGKTLFVLVTHKQQALLPTISSRCRIISMPFPRREEALAWLKEKGIAGSFLAESGNAPLAALDLAGRDRTLLDHVLEKLGNPASLDAVELAEICQKTPLPEFISWLQKWCHDLASQAFAGKIRYFPALSDRINAVSGRADKIELLKLIRKLSQAQRISSHPVNARLFIEELVLNYRNMAGR